MQQVLQSGEVHPRAVGTADYVVVLSSSGPQKVSV